MKFVGLTGGIGAGKSTVAGYLVERGAVVIDADALSRELQQPGQPLFDAIVARWGRRVLDDAGRLDRAALAAIVFADRAQLEELTAMAGPYTEVELVARARAHLGTPTVVVAEAAMYRARMYGMEGLIVVDTPVEVAVDRLVRLRGMQEEDARARIALQLDRASRLAGADYVVHNAGDLEALSEEVDRLWTWIQRLPDATPHLARG